MGIDWYATILDFYTEGLWTIDQVKVAVIKLKITEEQYKTITGEDYIASVS